MQMAEQYLINGLYKNKIYYALQILQISYTYCQSYKYFNTNSYINLMKIIVYRRSILKL